MNPEQLRPMLFIALAAVIFMLWQAWQQDYGPRPAAPQQTTGALGETPTVAATAGDATEVPDAPADTSAVIAADAPSPTPALEAAAGLISVETDVLRVTIDTRGGTLRSLDLLQYHQELDRPDLPFRLLNDSTPELFIAQSGLLGDNAPNHHDVLQAEATEYRLADGRDRIDVPLTWRSPTGVEIRKIYVFHRDSYKFDVRYEVHNESADPWSARMYGQLMRTQVTQDSGNMFIYTYMGGVLSSADKPYEKVDFSDMASEDVARDIQGGWAGMIQHYFASAWIPGSDAINHFYTKALSGARYVIGVISPGETVAPGAQGTLTLSAYIGPKVQSRMEAAAPGLERAVDYGWLFIIAQPLFWLLDLLHGWLGNWGWAIIVLTLLIKAAFFHLSATSYRSMARMRKLQPKLLQLRDRYGDDKARMNQAMMELYKTEKINPLGGCLPILVQIPVFISLYWMILETVELRHAPFMLWINDLSTHDPYFVLPVLMGASMVIQQRLNPTPPDPIQAKVMMALPFIFTFFFLWFPSGLVLYWVVNNVLSIAQQYVITKRIEAGGA